MVWQARVLASFGMSLRKESRACVLSLRISFGPVLHVSSMTRFKQSTGSVGTLCPVPHVLLVILLTLKSHCCHTHPSESHTHWV